MSIKRGELWLVNFDPAFGTEIQKTRPVLVVSNNIANHKNTKISLIPLSSQVRALGITVIVEPDITNGLTVPSMVKVPDICTFDKRRLVHKLGVLTPEKMTEVEMKLKKHLGL